MGITAEWEPSGKSPPSVPGLEVDTRGGEGSRVAVLTCLR